MKKGLSILLIAAALFGFYGGAVNLNDVLACKGYWEDKSEQTTADLNKLEDGLNQLKDNEKAYLDGQVELKDGEKALADGEAQYADGQAELAKGEADYAAAPGKLADARAQIAKGEKDLAAGEKKLANGYKEYNAGKEQLASGKAEVAKGEKDLAAGEKQLEEGKKTLAAGKQSKAGLDQLISGLETAKTGYSEQWKPGFNKADAQNPGLSQARSVIKNTLNTDDNKKKVGLIEKLANKSGLIDAANDAKTYKEFDGAVNDLAEAFTVAGKALSEIKTMADTYAVDTDETTALKAGLRTDTKVGEKKISEMTLAETKDALAASEQSLEKGKTDLNSGKQALAALDQMEKAGAATIGDQLSAMLGYPAATPISAVKPAIEKKVSDGEKAVEAGQKGVDSIKALIAGREKAQTTIGGIKAKAGDKLSMAAALDPQLASLGDAINALSGAVDLPNGKYAETYEQLQGGLVKLSATLEGLIKEIDKNVENFGAWDTGYKQLAAGKDQIVLGKDGDETKSLPYAFAMMLDNETISKVLKDKAPSLITPLTAYGKTKKLAADDLDDFESDMDVIVSQVIPGALQVLKGIRSEVETAINEGEAALEQGAAELDAGREKLKAGKQAVAVGESALEDAEKQLAKGEKDLAAGRAKLADGKKQYAQGLADFAAAPGKLADGRAKLADAEKQLEEGRAALAAGKAKLAEYEDGEQQVRDGLATLASTKADGGLTSILDRLSGDADFDNGDNHLELEEGLTAVKAGREYQADTGVLVTKEITNRAVGTAAGLGAGALAVLAAILSFLKKNKGAGISAILSAAAGGAGVAMGASAGTEFSSIAGSVVGATPWVACGILAGVALVHAIAHFASKAE